MIQHVLKTFIPTSTNPFPLVATFYEAFQEVTASAKASEAYKPYISLPAPTNDEKMDDEEISDFFGKIKQQLKGA